MVDSVFALLVILLLLSIVFSAAGYALGKVLPMVGGVLAGIVMLLIVALWCCMLRDDLSGASMSIDGLGLLIWMTAFPMLFVVGLASGVRGRPGWVIGAWVGTLAAAMFVAWSPDLSVTGLLAFFACCLAGGMWKPARTPAPMPTGAE